MELELKLKGEKMPKNCPRDYTSHISPLSQCKTASEGKQLVKGGDELFTEGCFLVHCVSYD